MMPTLDELSLMLNALHAVCPATAAALSRQLFDGDAGDVAWAIEGFYETLCADAVVSGQVTQPPPRQSAATHSRQ